MASKKNEPIKRPYATHYYVAGNYDAPAAHGATKVLSWAIRGCTWRIFDGQYERAVIYDRATEVAVRTVMLGPDGNLQMKFGCVLPPSRRNKGR